MSIREFWKWFAEHEPQLFDHEAERDRVFDDLAHELTKVSPYLTFEFGPKGQRRELVISAGGIRSAFPAVRALVSAAPTFDRWQITAFRPRRPPLVIHLGDKRVDPKDVQCSLLFDGEKAGIYLFIPGYNALDSEWKQVGYLLLDDALGEYDVESRMGLIE